jgi:hypothetical protein
MLATDEVRRGGRREPGTGGRGSRGEAPPVQNDDLQRVATGASSGSPVTVDFRA